MDLKKIGIVCCSNGMKQSYKKKLSLLEETLNGMGIHVVFSDCIYEKDAYFSASAKERADALMSFYRDDEITDIFDISGGDLANGILPYLDYEVIAKSNTCFWGYSDLTTVLNAIYTKAGKTSGLYQIRNILSKNKEQQIRDVKELLSVRSIFNIQYHFVQGNHMEGIVIGGNIRCFLKLGGTEYMPDFQDKILLLESRSGLVPQMETYLSQLQQLGVFDKIVGVLLGTFTQLDEERNKKMEQGNIEDGVYYPSMADLLKKYTREELPIAVTKDIGHGSDSKAIMVGTYHRL